MRPTLLLTKEYLDSRCIPEPNTGCWLWINWIDKDGYGGCKYGRTHRASWIIYYGPIPNDLLVLHKCDVPSCINPKHLFLCTQLDNMRDGFRKGRVTPPPPPKYKTQCPHGHLYRRKQSGQPYCSQCASIYHANKTEIKEHI